MVSVLLMLTTCEPSANMSPICRSRARFTSSGIVNSLSGKPVGAFHQSLGFDREQPFGVNVSGVHKVDSVLSRQLNDVHASIRVLRSVCRSEEHTSELQSPCNLVCRRL